MKKNVILYIRGTIRRKGTNIPIISDYNHRQSVNRAEINNAKLILEKDNLKLFRKLKKRYDASEIELHVNRGVLDEVFHIGNKKNKKLKPYELVYNKIVLSPMVWEVFFGPGLSERVITDNISRVFSCSKETSKESNIKPDNSNIKEEDKSVEPKEDTSAKPEKKFFIINHRGIVLNAFNDRDYAVKNAKSIINEHIEQDINCITNPKFLALKNIYLESLSADRKLFFEAINIDGVCTMQLEAICAYSRSYIDNPSFLSLFIIECDDTQILEAIYGIILCSHGYNIDDMHCDFKFATTDNMKKTEILKEVTKAFYRYEVDANATNAELDLAISKIIKDCSNDHLTLTQIFSIICQETEHRKIYKSYHAEEDLNPCIKEETVKNNTHLFKVANEMLLSILDNNNIKEN